jgi:hypothetical protein
MINVAIYFNSINSWNEWIGSFEQSAQRVTLIQRRHAAREDVCLQSREGSLKQWVPLKSSSYLLEDDSAMLVGMGNDTFYAAPYENQSNTDNHHNQFILIINFRKKVNK